MPGSNYHFWVPFLNRRPFSDFGVFVATAHLFVVREAGRRMGGTHPEADAACRCYA